MDYPLSSLAPGRLQQLQRREEKYNGVIMSQKMVVLTMLRAAGMDLGVLTDGWVALRDRETLAVK